MAKDYIGNVKRWIDQSDIDFFTHFIKVWIPFNAWFRAEYSSANTGSEILNLIKNQSSPLRNRVIRLLQGSDTEADQFKSYVSTLHDRLERQPLENRNRFISLKQCFIRANTVKQVSEVLEIIV
ncbi:MAG: hypothetical protein HC853_12450 [Anaerolineae bacterium]|nr:hypothetical protein [Anaerolineae bacterium]